MDFSFGLGLSSICSSSMGTISSLGRTKQPLTTTSRASFTVSSTAPGISPLSMGLMEFQLLRLLGCSPNVASMSMIRVTWWISVCRAIIRVLVGVLMRPPAPPIRSEDAMRIVRPATVLLLVTVLNAGQVRSDVTAARRTHAVNAQMGL